MKFWDKPEFKELQKVWYEKLADQDFKDIEAGNFLKEWDSNFFRNNFNQIKYDCTVQYYKKGRELLLTYPFENPHQRQIWELHCDGLTIREIARQVKSYRKSMVHYVIEKIASTIKHD